MRKNKKVDKYSRMKAIEGLYTGFRSLLFGIGKIKGNTTNTACLREVKEKMSFKPWYVNNLVFSSRLETSHFLLSYTRHRAKKLHREIGHLITHCPMKRQVNKMRTQVSLLSFTVLGNICLHGCIFN